MTSPATALEDIMSPEAVPTASVDIQHTIQTIDTNDLPLHKTPNFKANAIKSVVFCFAISMVGIAISMLGPTLPQLARNCGVDVETMGWLFTTRGVGYIISSAVVGKVLDHYQEKEKDPNKQFLVNKIILVVGCLLLSSSQTIIPFLPWFWVVCIAKVFTGIGAGLLDVSSNVLLMALWKERVNGPMQLLHASWGLGAFLAPLIVSATEAIVTSISGPGEELGIDERTGSMVYNRVIHVRVAYVTGAFFVFMVIPLALIALRSVMAPAADVEMVGKDTAEQNDAATTAVEKEETPEQLAEMKRLRNKRALVSVITGLALLFYVGAEIGFGGLIYSYVVELQGLANESHGALLNSMFWLSFTISRFAGVPISAFFSSRIMLIVDMIGCLLALLFMLIFSTNMIVLWICSILLGISLATQFPTTIAIPSTHLGMEATGAMTSTMVVFAIVGEMVVPLFITTTLRYTAPSAMFIVLFTVAAIASVLYIVLLFFIKPEKPTAKPVAKVIDNFDGELKTNSQ
jgi:FHS family Na+ dependent glucose MFS transporter 1